MLAERDGQFPMCENIRLAIDADQMAFDRTSADVEHAWDRENHQSSARAPH
jgi:hypothetical protein